MIRLSTLQFNTLKLFVSPEIGTLYVSIDQAKQYDQRPFRSMLIHEWISFKPGKGFYATRAGRDAYWDFLDHNIQRKNASLPLTAYFDERAYSLTPKRRLHVVAA